MNDFGRIEGTFCLHLPGSSGELDGPVSLTLSRLMTYIYIYMSYRPANLQILHFFIYSTNIRTKYFKHAAHSPFFPLQNAVYFIMLSCLVPV